MRVQKISGTIRHIFSTKMNNDYKQHRDVSIGDEMLKSVTVPSELDEFFQIDEEAEFYFWRFGRAHHLFAAKTMDGHVAEEKSSFLQARLMSVMILFVSIIVFSYSEDKVLPAFAFTFALLGFCLVLFNYLKIRNVISELSDQ